MGSSTSKTARAAGSAARKYPARSSPNITARPSQAPAPQPATSGPTVHPKAQATHDKTDEIPRDARDPALASRLNTLGAVQPNPHYLPTSTSQFDPQIREKTSHTLPDMMQAPSPSAFPDPRNSPVLRVLEARRRIGEEAELELSNVGRRSFAGRSYVDAATLQLVLMRQAKGDSNSNIESSLGIKKGRLDILEKSTIGAVHTI